MEAITLGDWHKSSNVAERVAETLRFGQTEKIERAPAGHRKYKVHVLLTIHSVGAGTSSVKTYHNGDNIGQN